jgi:hypothetical protein
MSTHHLNRGHSNGVHDLTHKYEIQCLDRIGRLMVVRISEIRRVGQHDSWVAVMPEGSVVAAPGIRELFPIAGDNERDGLEIRNMLFCCRFKSSYQLA